jgi:branched-chain amino acid transport system permease protein
LRTASLVVLVAIMLPLGLGQFWAYQLGLYALYATAAVGLGLCWGQGGFLPLGQALFFGVAAYLSGLVFIAFRGVPAIAVVVMPFIAIVSGGLAYAIGFVVFRRPGESGAYFSMITLALSPSKSRPVGTRSPAGLTGLRGSQVFPGWMTSPTSTTSRRPRYSPCSR